MFEVNKQPAKLVNYTPHTEKHGTEDKSAGSLRLELTCPNDALDAFYPGLKAMLFRKRGADEPAPKQDTLFDPEELSARRMPQIPAIKWDEEFPGYTLAVSPGLEASEVITLPGAKLSKFEFEPMDGGSCKIKLSANTYPDRDGHGFLCWNIQKALLLTLTAPTPEQVAQTVEMFPEDPSEAGTVGTGKQVLVTALDVTVSQSTHLTTVIASLSDGESVRAGDWAYRPTLDEIAVGIFDELGAGVEFAPACRSDYDQAAAA